MGWTGTGEKVAPANIKGWLEEELIGGSEIRAFKLEPIRHTPGSGEASHVAYGVTDDTEGRPIGLVVLLTFNGWNGGLDYKPMTTREGPYYYGAPEEMVRILEEAGPANEWEKGWLEKAGGAA